jgi:hypothetical protein
MLPPKKIPDPSTAQLRFRLPITSALVAGAMASTINFAFSADLPKPSEHSPSANLKIVVALPQPEGTVSLGIFNTAGKIVKILAAEQEISSLKSNLNGVEFLWDCTGEKGLPVQGSNYKAKGFLVSDLSTQGEAFHGNDWATDPEPKRPTAITGLRFEDGVFVISLKDVSGAAFATAHPIASEKPSAPLATSPQSSTPTPTLSPADRPVPEPKEELGLQAAAMDATQWRIEDGKAMLKTVDGIPLRQIKNLPGEPVPIAVAAAPNAPIVALLEQSRDRTRVRILRFRPLPGEKWKPAINPVTKTAVTDTGVNIWQTLFEHQILNTESQATAAKWLPALKKAPPSGKIKVPLTPSSIDTNQTPSAEVMASFDDEGLQLRSADGLLLRRITSTPGIKWACIAVDPADRTKLRMFQSDGAVIEEFSLPLPLSATPLDAGTFTPPASAKK